MTMRIMVVEDDALIALDIVSLLEDMGHEVMAEAADALTAWKLAEDDRPDLALVDIRLARDTDGGKLAQQLYDRLGVRSLFVSGSITDDFRRCRRLAFALRQRQFAAQKFLECAEQFQLIGK